MEKIIFTKDMEISPVMKDVYRRLRTNIEFTGSENKVICITSCREDDGKSTVSYLLSKSFAENGKRVLIIDADLRNSAMAKTLGFQGNYQGLSHLLAGRCTLDQVMYYTEYENLYVIPTGRFPKNPTELLGKQMMADLLKVVRKAFDYVIVDTPPLGAVIDTAVVAKECDGSILVIASGSVDRKNANAVKRQLMNANSNLIGVVLNKMESGTSIYGKHYGYGGYGGYGAYGGYGGYGGYGAQNAGNES